MTRTYSNPKVQNLFTSLESEFQNLEIQTSPHSRSGNHFTLKAIPGNIQDIVQFFKNHTFTLMDICATDYPKKPQRFEIVYQFLNLESNLRATLKASIGQNCTVNSISPIYKSANWFEREIFDMLGIQFSGHPNLKRILNECEFKHHPLRKDFPLTGYSEVSYCQTSKKIIQTPVNLSQEFRKMDFTTPWE